MRILVDISHPAHVHFFRNAIGEFRNRGHEVQIASRKKDITIELLDELGFGHRPLSTDAKSKSMVAFGREMLVHCGRLFLMAVRFKPDVLMQIGGPFIAPVGLVLRRPAVVFYDTEFAPTNRFTYPIATAVCTPECYEGSAGKHHIRYPGYHELAYLHPNWFTPDAGVLEEHGISRDEKIFVIRFVGWTAHHDYGEEGFRNETKSGLVHELARLGRVLITSEAPLPPDLEPYRSPIPFSQIHHVMAFATLLAGESATMASEAAVLGTPAFFISTTGRGYTNEQEARYGLVYNFKPDQQAACHEAILEMARRPLAELREEYGRKREKLLGERVDTTRWMVEYIESTYGG